MNAKSWCAIINNDEKDPRDNHRYYLHTWNFYGVLSIWSTKCKIYTIQNIFMTYILYFVDQINDQSFSRNVQYPNTSVKILDTISYHIELDK
jgi:hypothetical protein